MWNVKIQFLLNKWHVLADVAAEAVKDILNMSTYALAVI